MKASVILWAAFLLFRSQVAGGQTSPWLTDEQARDVATASIHAVYPEPCYSTYRDERLEGFLPFVRENPIVGNHLNNSVYFYSVASDSCEYLIAKDGKQVIASQVTMDCCEYGIVAVDRATAKSYWFGGKEKRTNAFKDFVRDEQLHPDSSQPTLFTALYLNLVWGGTEGKEIRSLEQLRDLVQTNFHSAYSLDERNNRWQRKSDTWWRHFRSRVPQLTLDTTYEPTSEWTIVRGYGFIGFQLTTPSRDPPPKGTPELFQWTLLVRPDGTIEERPSKTIYSSK